MNREDTVRLDLKVLLPEVPDEQDDCVRRLRTLVGKKGVADAHVTTEADGGPVLCVHYDPSVVGLAEIRRAAQLGGARLEGRYGHASIPIRATDAEDAVRRIESRLRDSDGVLSASVSVASQLVRVEIDSAGWAIWRSPRRGRQRPPGRA